MKGKEILIDTEEVQPEGPQPENLQQAVETSPETQWTRSAEGQFGQGPLMPGGH